MATNSLRYNKEGCFALLERPFYAPCLPYNVKISFQSEIFFSINLYLALYLSLALFSTIKEPTHIKVSSSLFNFLSRKLTGYGAESRKTGVRGGVPEDGGTGHRPGRRGAGWNPGRRG